MEPFDREPRQTHAMRRLLLYSAAALVAGVSGVLAWAWSDARLAIITIAVALGGGLVWAARRFPVAQRAQLIGAAIVAALAGFAMAILFPITRVACDCPPSPGTVGGSIFCNCALDHHVNLRIGIAVAGLV